MDSYDLHDFREIPSYKGYLASRFGRVVRMYPSLREVPTVLTSNRYRMVRMKKNKKRRSEFVHRLVCEAFSGKCPDGLECRHLDGDSLNNNSDNLKWGTAVENMADRAKHDRWKAFLERMRNRPRATGTSPSAETVLKIRTLRAGGMRQREIAEKFGLTQPDVSEICSGKRFPNDPYPCGYKNPSLREAFSMRGKK